MNQMAWSAILVAGLACLPGCGTKDPASSGGPDQPSVVIVSIDTLRADRTSVYGAERETTPGLEALARESLVFDGAHTVVAWTLTAHMSMLTGLYPEQHGVRTQGKAFGEERELLAERLSRAGFETYGLYFSGWIHPRHGFDRGFDVFQAHKNAEEAFANAKDVIGSRDPNRPLFLFLHLFDVHSVAINGTTSLAYEAPDRYLRRFLPDAPDRFAPGSALEIWNGEREPTAAELEGLEALYDGAIRHVDDRLSDALASWDEAGLLEEALLIVTSDHGESLGTRSASYAAHGGLFEEGMRVPLLIRRPDGERAGERVSQLVSLVDLVPTILNFCGLESAHPLPGLDLFGELPVDRLLIGQSQNLIALLRYPDKLLTPARPGGRGHRTRLDLDPEELRPIFAEDDLTGFSDLRVELFRHYRTLKKTQAWQPTEPGKAWVFSPSELDSLRALGYAEELDRGKEPATTR